MCDVFSSLVPAGEVHSRLEDLQRRGQRQQRRPHAPSKDLDSARTNVSDSTQSATELDGSTSADATAQSGSGSRRDLEASQKDEAQGSANGQPTKQSEAAIEADMHRSSEIAQPAAEPSTGQAGDEGLWADMAEEYCGTEEEHLEAALHEDTRNGQTCGVSPADSAEGDSEAERNRRAAQFFRAAQQTMAQQRAAAIDGVGCFSICKEAPAGLEHVQSGITQEMLALALDESVQQMNTSPWVPGGHPSTSADAAAEGGSVERSAASAQEARYKQRMMPQEWVATDNLLLTPQMGGVPMRPVSPQPVPGSKPLEKRLEGHVESKSAPHTHRSNTGTSSGGDSGMFSIQSLDGPSATDAAGHPPGSNEQASKEHPSASAPAAAAQPGATATQLPPAAVLDTAMPPSIQQTVTLGEAALAPHSQLAGSSAAGSSRASATEDQRAAGSSDERQTALGQLSGGDAPPPTQQPRTPRIGLSAILDSEADKPGCSRVLSNIPSVSPQPPVQRQHGGGLNLWLGRNLLTADDVAARVAAAGAAHAAIVASGRAAVAAAAKAAAAAADHSGGKPGSVPFSLISELWPESEYSITATETPAELPTCNADAAAAHAGSGSGRDAFSLSSELVPEEVYSIAGTVTPAGLPVRISDATAVSTEDAAAADAASGSGQVAFSLSSELSREEAYSIAGTGSPADLPAPIAHAARADANAASGSGRVAFSLSSELSAEETDSVAGSGTPDDRPAPAASGDPSREHAPAGTGHCKPPPDAATSLESGERIGAAKREESGPTFAPGTGKMPIQPATSGLTAQLRGKAAASGPGGQHGADGDKVGAFWPKGGRKRVVKQTALLGTFSPAESAGDEFEDTPDKLFGSMSLGNCTPLSSEAAETAAGREMGAGTSEMQQIPITGIADERTAQVHVQVEMQAAGPSDEESEGQPLSQQAGNGNLEGEGEMDEALSVMRSAGAEAEVSGCMADSASAADDEDMSKDEEIVYEMDPQQPLCWSPSLSRMLEETVSSLFAATPPKMPGEAGDNSADAET
ncbi:hypothetical protein COCSUDRAFT_62906 [Coccomyxa subellipsoidea C-169]|uniref:Uncharacterized protein n=1 Tax=Coccomyxa subellipsoidea (strain C-169) TaxID=574566 RepID=I0YY99_COCSC|nr:hypothetical protein COCSUDRAFT_62906 [Coccomyxa subellipsoidea C-169]EIE23368.1 hypothetical protein COCSUDRAFT_62906 [Coccomyxa subellipsoidea C-169]|eukprot:XP_005647912.1 hypothetical protein COCSUDRAFT_62906 [Coccomyxa subellipsoidea C-169]